MGLTDSPSPMIPINDSPQGLHAGQHGLTFAEPRADINVDVYRVGFQ